MGAFMSGMSDGVDIASRIQALHQQQQAQMQAEQARSAVGRMLMAPQSGGAPPLPPSAMPQPPMPGQASMPSQPMNTMDLAAAQDPTGQPSMPPLNAGGAPPLPQPMAAPPMPEPAPTGATGEPLAGNAAPSGDVVKDAQSTITNIANQIHAANPDITPEQLFDATNMHIEQMKGVRNDVRDYMMAQVELAKAQTRVQTAEIRVQGQKDVAGINADARTGAAEINSGSRERVAQTNAGARTESARITGGSRERVADSTAGSRERVAQTAAGSREKVAETNAGASDYRADQGYRGKVDSATAYNGGTTWTKPGPARRRGPAAAPAKPGAYTPDSLKAAVAAGKITRQQGEQIARTNGWIR